MIEFEKDKCTICKSENLTIVRCFFEDEEGRKVPLDHYDAHCNDCEHYFILVDL